MGPEKTVEDIRHTKDHMAVAEGIAPLFLGGDHAVTHPLVKGIAGRYEGLSILHFDAHPNLYDETAMVSAKLLKEVAARFTSVPPAPPPAIKTVDRLCFSD